MVRVDGLIADFESAQLCPNIYETETAVECCCFAVMSGDDELDRLETRHLIG